VDFRVLGPVEAYSNDHVISLGRPQERLVLAILLVDAGQLVPVDTLIDRVWETAPDGARRTLQVHVARLRRLLTRGTVGASIPLVRRSGGYLLGIDPGCVDLHRFRRLVATARDANGSGIGQVAELRKAIGLWRGEPLSGLPGPWAARHRAAWQQEYLDAVTAWAQAELAAGDPATVIGPLTELTDQHPFAETLAVELIRALHRVGRTADALEVYAHTRKTLADELGIDPGHDLQQQHQIILRGTRLRPARVRHTPQAGPVPEQLPADVRGFTGRVDYLAPLGTLLSTEDNPSAARIAAISGTAGVGKTALAVHWAHQVKNRFPDGQLYVDLRGFGPMEFAMAPSEAVRGFLDALGVPRSRVPDNLDAQVGLYRTLTANRRMLVVLDNARDVEQVRPLLPGSPSALVLVTSRNQLTSLVAVEGAHLLTLDLPPMAEARELLAQRLGPDRIAADPDAVDEIVHACARLPLALAIAAARAQLTGFPLATLAGQLREAGHPLDALDAGDRASQVRVVFSWSYKALTSPAARLFRLLSLHPGPDISATAAASLAGRPPAETRQMLAELAGGNVIVEHVPGRYAFHDLLRAYATELTSTIDSSEQRQAAETRLLDYYLHTAHNAARLLFPDGDPDIPPLAPPAKNTFPDRLIGRQAAISWLTAERRVLLSVLELAAAGDFDTLDWADCQDIRHLPLLAGVIPFFRMLTTELSRSPSRLSSPLTHPSTRGGEARKSGQRRLSCAKAEHLSRRALCNR
jgi:DNA-binding SARP family transcriptional activator